MTDPFASARSKLAWAQEHLPDLNRRIEEWSELDPYAEIIEADPQRPGYEIHKLKLVKPLPDAFGNATGDLVGNLRSVLDMAGYAIAAALNNPTARNTNFPFASDVHHMASSIGRSADLPKEIQSLFCGFQPYRGGDDLLWALNEMCNGNKHKIVTPMCAPVLRNFASIRGKGRFFSMPDPHVWNYAKSEMEVFTLGPPLFPDAKCDYDLDFSAFVAVHEIPVVEGHEIVQLLALLCNKVQSILMAIEAESKRLGIVKWSSHVQDLPRGTP